MFNIFCSVSALVLSLLCRRLNEMAHTTKGDYFCLGAPSRDKKMEQKVRVWKKAESTVWYFNTKVLGTYLWFIIWGNGFQRERNKSFVLGFLLALQETEHDDDNSRRGAIIAHFIEGLQSATEGVVLF